ncbi:nipped-B-like protein (delangin) (scc2 homolog) [Schistosoma mansoni]|uniref:nipped-B-like protein (delangin) (scc2 homolog) n=1 Tax=Schistosoma mansoni TaxID=6183 RepID=UPI00022DCAAA|nr:nipped-B-like protein (delangin) (scc2 homolog) [Schistosoma mansoni]|eukprot:XP_018654121.1 nipped-B-like protein (delangin) (scc2 homolog) [Schistosoma mansoni]
MEDPSTLHTSHSPCKADQLCTEHSPSPKINDLTFESSGYDTNSAQTRRIPDPALSQIFHSVALFHTYQPTCEPDKGVDNEGGGLFDDWVDAPKLSESPVVSVPTVPNKSNPTGCTSQTPCISSTSAAVKEKLCICADNESVGSLPRSPLSMLSNNSYPTTSGKNIPVPFHNSTSAVTVSASAVAVSLSVSKVNTPSPTRLFDSLDENLTTNLSTCSALEEQVNCAPHGLAAYLPRCNNQRISSAHPSVFSNEDIPVTFANSVSPRPVLSPGIDCINISSVSPLGLTVRNSSSSKTIGFSGNDPTTYSKPKRNGRGRFSSGKHRGGGRRRRTELEELKRWSVLDHANPGLEQKNVDLCEVRYSPLNPATYRDPGTTFAISEASVQTTISKKDISNLNFSDVCNQYGGFTEALVERVKRRRQQREMESKVFKASPNKDTLRSSCEVSPLSTPSPGQSHLKVTSPVRMHKSASFLKRENKKGTQRTTFKTERESQGKEGSISAAVNDCTKLIHSTDSDCSLSPTSTILSSVQSHSPSISSVPPINTLQPSPPVLSYQKIDSTSNCHSHDTTVYDRSSRPFVPCNVKSPNNDVALISLSTQVNDQDSDFSDVKQSHAKSKLKDTKSSLTSNYRDPVTVQSFRSRSIHGSCARSNNSSLHLPPLLPLNLCSSSLLHKPLSVDVLESAKCQDHVAETHRIAKKRHKHNREQLGVSDNSSTRNGYFTETVLWSDPEWSSSLIGLDCARTALNIIVGPDMPRPLLMEDLIEGIVSVVKHQLDCLIHNIMRVTSHTPHYQSSSVSPSFSILGHIGYRITQIMILLVNLMRLQPNRFTDNLVINLTSLGMAIPSYSLTSGTSITNEWKRFLLSPQKLFNFISHSENPSEFMGSSAKTLGTLFVVSWPEHLQRSSLALLGALYGQYEAHRKMIVDEIFRTFLSGLDVKRKSAPSVSTETEKIIYPSDRRTAKTFRLLSSSYFYEEYYGSKAKSNVSHSIQNESPQYLYIHALSALFLCITQGLIHTPNLSFPANNCSNPSIRKFPSSAMSTPTQSSFFSEAVTTDNAQFSKDEKHVLNSYSTAVRHAHYLLSGLFKRVSLKAEYDIRSVWETVTNDLLSVTFHAPIEWPASAILLNVLSSLLIQQLNQTNQNATISTNPTTSRSRNTELCGKLLAVDTLASLIVGLKRGAKVYNLDLPSSLFIQNKNHSDLEDVKDNCMKTNKCQTRLIGLLSSPIPIIHHWYFSFYDIFQMSDKDDDSNFSEICERLNLDQNMTYLPDLCSKYYDFLLLTAHRFHLAAWLHNSNRNVPVTNLDIPTGNVKDHSTNSTKNKVCVERLRHQLLAELSLTHLNSSVSGLGFPFAKQNISSLSAACMGCPNSSQHLSSRSRANCICCMGWGGSFLAQSMSSQRFITYTHIPKLCRNIAGESSVPMRSKALRCLASVIDADPKLMSINKDTKNKKTTSSSPIFDISNIVRARLLDNSTAVREAAVDLISRYLTLRPQFLAEYYSVIVERVLDKGVSVRKRVIRCFRDLLLNDWNKFLNSPNSSSDGHSSSLIGNQICTDICLKLIRRLHDENSIQKLITEAFQELWLTPISKSHSRFSKVLDRRIISLASVTITLRPNNFDLLNTFIVQDLSSGEPHPSWSQFDAACKQIIGRLIVLIKRRIGPLLVPTSKQLIKQSHSVESRTSSQSPSFLSNMHGLMACLHLVSYSKPNLVRPHIGFLMDLLHKICLSVPGTLTSTGQTENQMKPTNTQFLYHLINVVEIVLTEIASNLNESDSPPMEEAMFAGVPRTNFFQLQNDLLQFVQRQGRLVVDSALSCLAVLVNQVLKDQTQVICCFAQFYDLSLELREALSTKISTSARISSKTRPSILRALYTVGLICKYFTLDYSFNRNKKSGMSNSNLLDEVVDILMLFAEYASVRIHVQSSTTFSNPSSSMNDLNNEGVYSSHMKSDMIDPDLCRKAITGLGFLLFRHDQLFCTGSVQLFLTRFLSTVQNSLTNNHPNDGSSFFEIQCIILDNLTHYLLQKERKATADNRLWATRSKRESLKELTDEVTGHSSAVAQTYLPIVLKYCILTPSTSVRSSALSLISTILRQGLIHPSHVLSSLICLQTDSDPSIRSRASVCLTEVERKIPGFAAMRAVSGIRMSHQLQVIIHTNEFSSLIVRGAKDSKIASESKSLSPTNNSTSTVFCINYGLYTMLRTNRQYRRSLIVNLLSIFDEYQKSLHTTENENIQNRLSQLIFIADHLAHFPYVVLDEVYYVADLIEQRISLIGSTILRSLYRSLLSTAQNKCSNPEICELSGSSVNSDRKFTSETDLMDFLDKCEANLPREYDFNTSYKYMETMKALDNQISYSSSEKDLQNMFKHCQSDTLKGKTRSSMVYAGPSCLLLMTIRKFIREYYGVTYSKLKDYSPSDVSKIWEKPILLIKQSSVSGQLMTLSCIVYQYVFNTGWSDVSKGPPDHILLRHFLVLRRELMLHEDNTLNEQSAKCKSKHSVQVSDIENDIKEECQVEMKSGECSTTSCNPSTTSKHSKSNSAECLSSVKHSLDSSFNQTIRKSNKQLGKRKIVKRQSSKSSLSSLSDCSDEAIGDTGIKKKEKHPVDLQSQCSLSKPIKKHRRLSEHSSYSTGSDSGELNNLRLQKIGSSRGHQSLLQSSPDSSNKLNFQNQTRRTHFELLDSDANSETNSVDSSVRKNNKIGMISNVKQPSVSNYANQTKKQSTSQSYMQKISKTKKSNYQDSGAISHANSLSHQCRSTNSKQSAGPTRTLAPLPSAMMNSTNTSRLGKHSVTNRKTKHNYKRSEFASKYETKHVPHHFASGSNHHISRVKNSKSKSLSSKTSHSNESRTHKPHSEEQRTSKKHLSECQSFKMHQIDSATKEASIRNNQKVYNLLFILFGTNAFLISFNSVVCFFPQSS